VKPGRILYEMGGVDESVAREAFRLAAYKLPMATKFISGRLRYEVECARDEGSVPRGIDAKAAELKKELFNLRFQQAMGQIENPMRLRALRKISQNQNDLKEKHGRV